MTEQTLSPTRPYILKAIYQWILDNNCTPYILVSTAFSGVHVPQQFVHDNQIVLNLLPSAVHQLDMTNDAVSFHARFGGVSHHIYVPMAAIMGVYAKESGQGSFFDPEEYPTDTVDNNEAEKNTPSKKGKLSFVD